MDAAASARRMNLRGAASALLLAASSAGAQASYRHEHEPIGNVRQMYDGVLSPFLAANTFRNIHRLFPTRAVRASAAPRPLPAADRQITEVTFRDRDNSWSLEQYLELNRVSGLLVLHDGRIALERYRLGNARDSRWMSMSIAKSITSTLIGAAVRQGHIRSLDDPVTRYVPTLRGSAYDGASVRDVLMMASGVRWNETYTDPASDRRKLLEAQIAQTPGAAMALMASLPRAGAPGTRNTYSTGETQVAAEILRGAVRMPLSRYLEERIWSRYGMEADANWWLDSPDGVEIGGSGFSATLRDFARFGQFLLDGGVAGGDSILPAGWIAEATTPKRLRSGELLQYGYLWWPFPSPVRSDSAFAGVGIFGQYLYVNPRARVVIALWSAQTRPTGGEVLNDVAFFDAVVQQLRKPRG